MDAHSPTPYSKDVLMAVRAAFDGAANGGQQIAMMDWIMEVCRIRHLSFAGEDTHTMAFRDGLRFAGLQIAGMRSEKALKYTKEALAAKAARRSASRRTTTRQEAKP